MYKDNEPSGADHNFQTLDANHSNYTYVVDAAVLDQRAEAPDVGLARFGVTVCTSGCGLCVRAWGDPVEAYALECSCVSSNRAKTWAHNVRPPPGQKWGSICIALRMCNTDMACMRKEKQPSMTVEGQ